MRTRFTEFSLRHCNYYTSEIVSKCLWILLQTLKLRYLAFDRHNLVLKQTNKFDRQNLRASNCDNSPPNFSGMHVNTRCYLWSRWPVSKIYLKHVFSKGIDLFPLEGAWEVIDASLGGVGRKMERIRKVMLHVWRWSEYSHGRNWVSCLVGQWRSDRWEKLFEGDERR